MAISKITLNGQTQMDVTGKTVTSGSLLNGVTALKNDGTDITGNIASKSSSDLTASGATVTAPAGYYGSAASKSVASGTAGTPTASKGTVSNHAVTITPSVTNTTGYISGSTITGTGVSVSASELVSGTKSITSSGTTDVTIYASASVAAGLATTPATTVTANPSISVSSGGLITATASATKSITPTVGAGYVLGTAGTVTVSGSNTSQLSTQAAQTIHPSTEEQSVTAGVYLTGDQTIAPVTTTNLIANNILRGVTVEVGDSEDPDRVASVQGVLDVDVVVDPTLSNAGEAADAKVTGDKILTLKNDITGLNAYNILDNCEKTSETASGITYAWNEDGSCTVSGTATATSFNTIFISQTSLPSGIIAGDAYSIKYSSTNIYLYIYNYSTPSPSAMVGTLADHTFRVPSSCTGMLIRLWIANGTSIQTPVTVKPVILSADRYYANKATIYGGANVYTSANDIAENCTVFAKNNNGSSSISNVPYFPCYLETVVADSSTALQKVYPYQTGTNGVMIRTKVSGTWGSWVAV